MLTTNYDSLYKFLIEFCKIKSIVGSDNGENQAADFLYDKFKQLEYFKQNPSNIWFDSLEDDLLNRKNFCAFIEAKNKTNKTIVFIGHIDVVNTDVCGEMSDLAFNPVEYTEKLKTLNLDEDISKDLLSGDWLFGRGVSDMKSGLTVLSAIFSELSMNTDTIECNYMLLGLADEENNGFGIHQAIKMMDKMKREKSLEFICCIDSEPTITGEEKDIPRVYLGTIGCATPFAFFIGKESHVGEYFEGINSSLIASYFNVSVEGDYNTSDTWKGVNYSPLTCLKIQELRDGYSVTLPERTVACYNILMVQRKASDILMYFAEKSEIALQNSINHVKRNRDYLFNNGSTSLPEIDYKYRIIYYSELIEMVEKITGRSHNDLALEILKDVDYLKDSQERGIYLVNKFVDIAGVDGLTVIIGFLSPYCQPRVNYGKKIGEIAIRKSVALLQDWYSSQYNKPFIVSEIYEGISDMSELGFQESDEELSIIKNNLVGYNVEIKTPFNYMKSLDVPVINIGPVGKDAHKMTERVYLPYTFNILPLKIKKFIEFYLENFKSRT